MTREEFDSLKIGEVVICIDVFKLIPNTNSPPLRINGEYIVRGKKLCNCGNTVIDVSIPLSASPNPNTIGVKCSKCNNIIDISDIWWCGAYRFAKKKSETIENDAAMAELLKKEVMLN